MHKLKLEQSLSQTLVDNIKNQGDATIDAVQKQQTATLSAITSAADLQVTRLGNTTEAKKIELETKKDAMLTEIATKGAENVASNKVALNQHTELKKTALDNHEIDKEVMMNELYAELEADLRLLVTEAIVDKGIVANGADWHLLGYGAYYVADLLNSNYINAPVLDPQEAQGVVFISEADRGAYKVIRYYSVQKKMHFALKVNNKWSDWSTLSEGGGIKYEYEQPNHGFTFTAVQLNGTTGLWEKAAKDTGADGIAIRKDDNEFELVLNGSHLIPANTTDDKGLPFAEDEFYFLSNNVAGSFQREKPQNIFQSLFRTYKDEELRMVAEVQIDTPVNLVPRILINEINNLGLQLKEDSRLHTESKSVVGGINENKNRIDTLEQKTVNNVNGEAEGLQLVGDDPYLLFGVSAEKGYLGATGEDLYYRKGGLDSTRHKIYMQGFESPFITQNFEVETDPNGIINIQQTGQKIAGYRYYDTINKKTLKCIKNNSLTYADSEYYIAIGNNSLSAYIEVLQEIGKTKEIVSRSETVQGGVYTFNSDIRLYNFIDILIGGTTEGLATYMTLYVSEVLLGLDFEISGVNDTLFFSIDSTKLTLREKQVIGEDSFTRIKIVARK